MADRFVSSLASGAGDGSSEASAWTLLQAQNLADGDDVWIKADGDYPLVTLGVNTFQPINAQSRFRGYQSTPGDLAHPGVVFDAEQTPGNVVSLSQADTVLENVRIINGSPVSPSIGVSATGPFCLVRRVSVDGVGWYGIELGGLGSLADECEAVNVSLLVPGFAAGFRMSSANSACRNCFAHDIDGDGFVAAAGTAAIGGFDGCIAVNNTQAGFDVAPQPGYVIPLRHCVSMGNGVGLAVNQLSGNDADVVNSIIGANATGIAGHATALSRVRVAGLARWGNTIDVGGNVQLRNLGDIVDLAGDPFVDSGGPQYDFRIRADQRELLGRAVSGFIVAGQASGWRSSADFGAVQFPISPVINPLLG